MSVPPDHPDGKSKGYPSRLLRWGFALPGWLYRVGLGWTLGKRFLALTHRGRKSGHVYHTVLESSPSTRRPKRASLLPPTAPGPTGTGISKPNLP